LVIFIVFSAIVGPHVVSSGLVQHDGFQLYGGAGKAMLFGVLALGLLVQRKGFAARIGRWHWANTLWLILSVAALVIAWAGINKLINDPHLVGWAVLANVSLVASIIFVAGGSFGPATLRLLAKTYRRELLIALGLTVAFYAFLNAVYGLWSILATIVLHMVNWLLNLVGVTASVLPGHSLVLDKFAVTINEYCSGIESIALFTALYALVGVLDWHRFNHRRFLLIFPVGLAALFGFNILRVFVLILAGYYINPTIAFSLFHTYAGMVFFILYSILFWAVSYRWLLAD